MNAYFVGVAAVVGTFASLDLVLVDVLVSDVEEDSLVFVSSVEDVSCLPTSVKA
jgi:hypothetical protein